VVGIGTVIVLLVMMGIITVQREMEKGGIHRRFIQNYMDLWKLADA
jgi:hypothetical protein